MVNADEKLSKNVSDAPRMSAVAVSLGCLYGDAVCKEYGWTWMDFGQDAEHVQHGVVSPEQNFCVPTMTFIWRILEGQNIGLGGENDNTVLLLFNMLDGMDSHPDKQKMIPLL